MASICGLQLRAPDEMWVIYTRKYTWGLQKCLSMRRFSAAFNRETHFGDTGDAVSFPSVPGQAALSHGCSPCKTLFTCQGGWGKGEGRGTHTTPHRTPSSCQARTQAEAFVINSRDSRAEVLKQPMNAVSETAVPIRIFNIHDQLQTPRASCRRRLQA